MTHLEIERLVRKMTELLQKGGGPELAPKLAGDYAAACHAANLRLQQCEAMIKAGDRHQAIQLAETAPNLLDLITVLEFRGGDEWRLFCEQNSLPVAERIDARSVHELNGCYALGINTDHPLYATYRKAVLGRNDAEALKALQSITRLNPNDANAATELARLDAKVLSAQINNLGDLITGGDAASVVAAIQAIEDYGFKSRPDGDVWCKAEIIRCALLADEAAGMKAAGQWAEALAKLDFIRHLQKEFKLELPGTTLKQIEAIHGWADGEREKDRKERAFKALLAELHFRIQQSEEKDTAARYIKLPELRQDAEALHKVWRSLTDLARAIPEEATAAFRKRSALLDAEVARRTAIRFRAVLAGGAIALIAGGIIAWFAVERTKAADFVHQLQVAVAQRRPRTAEQLIDRLRTSEKRLLGGGSMNAALGQAETFVTEQQALLGNFQAAFARLPTKLEGEPNAGQINVIADQLAQTKAALAALAPDYQAENEPRVQAFEQLWQQYLSAGGVVINGILEQWISSAEKQCDQLDYRAPVATAAAWDATLSGVIQKIDDSEAGFKNHVNLRSDLVQRAAAVRARFAAYDRELRKMSDGMAALKKAGSMADYSAAITLVASSEFSTAPAVAAANAVQALGAGEEAALRSLLNATNPATWAFITKKKAGNFIPDTAMPAERDYFQRLFDDPAVNASHLHYRLWLDTGNTKSVDWITAGLMSESEGWKKIRAWTAAANADSATFDDHEYGSFSGQLKLTPTQPIYRLETIAEPDGTAAFGSVGLVNVYKSGAGYGGSLLEVLDAVKDSREGSPLFRGQLFCNLIEIMEFQPDAWGLTFSPSARADAAKIRAIAGGPIESGDWLVRSKAAKWSEKLEQFFSSEKSTSYAKEAADTLGLVRSVANDGFHYIGYVGLDGKPVLTAAFPDGSAPAEMWGYDPASRRPARYASAAMPLSPLFALPVSTAEYLAKAGVSRETPSLANTLPPLFRALKTP